MAKLTAALRAHQIVHDEVGISDLLEIAIREEVEFAKRVQKEVGDWSSAPLPEKVTAYEECQPRPERMTFERVQEIIRAGFGEAD